IQHPLDHHTIVPGLPPQEPIGNGQQQREQLPLCPSTPTAPASLTGPSCSSESGGSQATSRHRPELLFIDVDNFKTINDTNGQIIGKLVLCTTA
ncbi:diguanylate cyclase domain-containing protein, partial [Streptomyces sp. NPDC058171]